MIAIQHHGIEQKVYPHTEHRNKWAYHTERQNVDICSLAHPKVSAVASYIEYQHTNINAPLSQYITSPE